MTKHTPGPWHAEKIDAEEWTISVPHELRGPLAAVYGRANVEADAKLIAAAPALADALEAGLAWEEATRARLGLPQVDAPEWAHAARAAIRAAGRIP